MSMTTITIVYWAIILAMVPFGIFAIKQFKKALDEEVEAVHKRVCETWNIRDEA